MQWWTDFLDWLNSDAGWRIVSSAVIPFVAIILAGIVAAAIGRASARKVIELSEREVRASAVTALISAARKAAVWNTLPAPEQQHIDHLIGDAEIRLRLLPIAGTGLAADWSRHEIAGMKRNAISFSFQAEQSLLVFRDRLIEWQGRPNRAKKLFKNDLDSWAYDSSTSEQELVHQQQKWAAQQVTETGPIATVTTTPFTRPPSPAPLQAPVMESAAATSAGGTSAGATSAGGASAGGTSAGGMAVGVSAASAAAPPSVETVSSAAAAPATAAPSPTVTPHPAPDSPEPALVEPRFSSPEATVEAGEEPHPLVEPASFSTQDVSESAASESNEGERSEGESDIDHESQSDESAGSNQDHEDREHDHHDEHRTGEDQHDQWRG